MSFQTRKTFVHLQTQIKIFLMKTAMQLKCFQAQKGSKDIGKIVHQWFNHNFTKLREYFLYAKKTKIMTLFL